MKTDSEFLALRQRLIRACDKYHAAKDKASAAALGSAASKQAELLRADWLALLEEWYAQVKRNYPDFWGAYEGFIEAGLCGSVRGGPSFVETLDEWLAQGHPAPAETFIATREGFDADAVRVPLPADPEALRKLVGTLATDWLFKKAFLDKASEVYEAGDLGGFRFWCRRAIRSMEWDRQLAAA